jgi:predicted anti-sigma-YlaC factor YlaD
MNCEWVKDNLSAYIDGELNTHQKELIESHLPECINCKAELNRLSAAWDALTLWEDEQPHLYLKEAILSAVKREKHSRLLHMALPVAAVLIISLGILLFYNVVDHFDTNTIISEKRTVQPQMQIESAKLDEREVIKNLHIIEEQEFYDNVEMLKTIDYLPLVEDSHDNTSSLGYFAA